MERSGRRGGNYELQVTNYETGLERPGRVDRMLVRQEAYGVQGGPAWKSDFIMTPKADSRRSFGTA